MRNHLAKVIHYFAQFSYAPTFDELYTYFPIKISKKSLHSLLKSEYDAGKLLRIQHKNSFSLFPGSTNPYPLIPNPCRYTLPQYSTPLRNKSKSKIKIKIIKSIGMLQIYISILKWLPLVRFVGITGKSAVEGYRQNDDIDLLIITRGRYIWTTRFFVVLMAKILGIHGGKGVCLNLFFDEQDLLIPKKKQNEYIAHELLQIKPVLDKGSVYSRLIETNKWVFTIFPNSCSVIPAKAGIQTIISIQKRVIFDWIPSSEGMTHKIDLLFKSIQLPIIKKNKTGFLITPTQLWLFKQDFERKLKRKGMRKVI